ncbi:TetR/AcrR family transcriptional regulator [Streptomyces spectabilis]|uniref:TetR family transcriptional regulator n=1 Tax=Streptomyces spectabilis TaxID=68270 RepID=A0A5P2X5Q1_STRST|nr:TetR/AcrR family transcriptional regulator [Streptomyces spectabilis]MBB5101768.1 TetR/AcrR family transcriptional repressor of nem operon [Streptomyces spectabilis]MCI3900948.1 TetR/AcrR family transcriptional regulator [Streptomyces spectabilis]QEV58455.1 TetR family transcriptional regulator [Streptomyces spectabilis]GGV50059.1 TetR family transcriptional regulator [Streptomyces spectabilis]
MARSKEFDPDAALQSALELFWGKGYEATSMADLVAHLGIGRASLYATFGNKHELYLKALDRYAQTREPELVEELSRPGPALPGVRILVRRFAAEASAADCRRTGCFITNTAAELAPHDEAADRRIERNWEGLETLLRAALTRARAQGEIPDDRDPRALARMLLVLLQGIRVVGKVSGGPDRVRDAAEQALALLD